MLLWYEVWTSCKRIAQSSHDNEVTALPLKQIDSFDLEDKKLFTAFSMPRVRLASFLFKFD